MWHRYCFFKSLIGYLGTLFIACIKIINSGDNHEVKAALSGCVFEPEYYEGVTITGTEHNSRDFTLTCSEQ